MKQSTFKEVLTTAMAWDRVGSESMKYPTFQTQQELELFENFLNMLNDYQLLDQLSFMTYLKTHERAQQNKEVSI